MKKLFAIILILFSVNCFGQTNGTNGKIVKYASDSIKIEQPKILIPPDSIAIVSLKDYQTFFVWLQDNATKSQYDKLKPEDILIAFSEWAIREWNRKNKTK